jgi:hypothetical protein
MRQPAAAGTRERLKEQPAGRERPATRPERPTGSALLDLAERPLKRRFEMLAEEW